jgi:hypothetical protein
MFARWCVGGDDDELVAAEPGDRVDIAGALNSTFAAARSKSSPAACPDRSFVFLRPSSRGRANPGPGAPDGAD